MLVARPGRLVVAVAVAVAARLPSRGSRRSGDRVHIAGAQPGVAIVDVDVDDHGACSQRVAIVVVGGGAGACEVNDRVLAEHRRARGRPGAVARDGQWVFRRTFTMPQHDAAVRGVV